MRALAHRRHIPEDIVLEEFERECRRLEADAKVHCYIGLIAEKHVREALVRR